MRTHPNALPYSLLGALMLATVLVAACSETEIINIGGPTQVQGGGGGGGSTDPGQPAGCPQIVRTTLGSMGGTAPDGTPIPGAVRTAQRGSVLTLDITPRDAQGNAVPTACHDAQPTVTAVPPNVCGLGSGGNPFTPQLRLLAAGTCIVTASANGFADSKDFTVTP